MAFNAGMISIWHHKYEVFFTRPPYKQYFRAGLKITQIKVNLCLQIVLKTNTLLY